MPFDPAGVAALVAQAQARTLDGVFAISAAATPRRLSSPAGGLPASLFLAPRSPATARLYTWTANYRRRLLSGSLVADVAYDLVARGLLAQQALDQMDQVDRRYPRTYLFGQLLNPD